jgi:diguanylate cyclase (GGDEF)-like protein
VTTLAGALAMLAFIVTRQSIVLQRDQNLRLEISELNEQIDGLISQVGRDPLTGLFNHRAIHERVDHELAVGRATSEPVAVALIDVDNFKSINDTLGHQAGDRVLRAVSSILTAACRSTDVAARYAGDEFMLVLPGLDETHAGGVCARIAQEVRRINEDLNLGKGAHVSLSVGVAVTHGCQRSVAQTVAIADAAMYDAKEGGKDRVVVVNADTLEISKTHAQVRTPDAVIAESRSRFWADQGRCAG